MGLHTAGEAAATKNSFPSAYLTFKQPGLALIPCWNFAEFQNNKLSLFNTENNSKKNYSWTEFNSEKIYISIYKKKSCYRLPQKRDLQTKF